MQVYFYIYLVCFTLKAIGQANQNNRLINRKLKKRLNKTNDDEFLYNFSFLINVLILFLFLLDFEI